LPLPFGSDEHSSGDDIESPCLKAFDKLVEFRKPPFYTLNAYAAGDDPGYLGRFTGDPPVRGYKRVGRLDRVAYPDRTLLARLGESQSISLIHVFSESDQNDQDERCGKSQDQKDIFYCFIEFQDSPSSRVVLKDHVTPKDAIRTSIYK
jgi:hypothetical protein